MLESLSKEELLELISREFADVTREGGVSWLEADALDGGGQQYLYDLAKQHDIENCWQELLDSPTWDIQEWSSNWSFLDPIGFRYYMAAATARELRSGTHLVTDFHFWFNHQEKFSAFTNAQRLVVAEFVLYKLLEDRRKNYPNMVDQPVVSTEPFTLDSKIIDTGWADAFLAWQIHLSER